ncbi:glutaredoxin family protein [Cytobacillus purgationiresistens]|uniref:Glutaredoxin n=1 Tax=Cytobacillus purgationiresistens TaxID=863449 RepID=A0ABU0AQ70_9BACI|nr:glutaredoxin family protein [Cytobacillus purgationiresistens]MDQ0273433.1 glutaredoxin [Cytobacillus purgationiresistens]
MKESRLNLYTRSRCPLCVKAQRVIADVREEHDFIYTELDIDESDEWTEKYGLMIPVVEIDGEIIQYGQIDHFTVLEALQKK